MNKAKYTAKKKKITLELRSLKAKLDPNMNPLPMPDEDHNSFRDFLTFCGSNGRGRNTEMRKRNHWNDRFYQWRSTVMRIEYLEDQLEDLEVKRKVTDQSDKLDKVFDRVNKLTSEALDLPLDSLRPDMKAIVGAGKLMLDIKKERKTDVDQNPFSQLDEAIDLLIEQGLLPESIASQSRENLVRYYKEQKKLFENEDSE